MRRTPADTLCAEDMRMSTHGLDRQVAIYTTGEPATVSPEHWERRARETLADGPFGYVAGAAGAEDTMRANRQAFDRWRIWPRMLRDVADRDLTVDLLGTTLPTPFLLAPVGVQGIIHPEAEIPAARAAAATGVPFILSTLS